MINQPIIIIPGDYPLQCQGSPHLERLRPYGDVKLFGDLPQDMAEQIERARDATVLARVRLPATIPAPFAQLRPSCLVLPW